MCLAEGFGGHLGTGLDNPESDSCSALASFHISVAFASRCTASSASSIALSVSDVFTNLAMDFFPGTLSATIDFALAIDSTAVCNEVIADLRAMSFNLRHASDSISLPGVRRGCPAVHTQFQDRDCFLDRYCSNTGGACAHSG